MCIIYVQQSNVMSAYRGVGVLAGVAGGRRDDLHDLDGAGDAVVGFIFMCLVSYVYLYVCNGGAGVV